MESYSVQAVLSVSDKGFSDKMRGAVNTLEDLDDTSKKTSSSIMDIAKGVGAFKAVSIAADTLKASLSGAIDRFDALNQYPKVMQNLGYTTEDASVSLDKLSDGISGLPTALDDAATYTKQWALATGDLEKATDLYLAINDGAIAYGASAEQAASCQEQLNQMISNGSYDLQSWKIINQNCPGLLDAVAKSMLGESAAASDLRTALNEGTVTTDQFESTLISLDKNGTESVTAFSVAAKSATGGISTSVTNMKTAVVRGMENIIRSTNDALENNGLPGFQGMVENVTSGINTAFSIASDGAEVLVSNLDILAPALGTTAAGFITYKAAMDVSNKHTAFKKSMTEAVERLNAVKNATDLASTATSAQEAAVLSAEIAERKMSAARKADRDAMQAQTVAKELATKASKVQADAEKAAKLEIKAKEAEEKLATAQAKLKEAQEQASAAATKSRAAQERAAAKVAKAQADVDKAATEVILAKAKAEQSGSSAATLSARADELAAKASEAQAEANSKASLASAKKAETEKMETIATTAATRAEDANTAATKAGEEAAKVSNISIAAKTALLGVLSGEYTIAEAGQLAWNAAMSANPIGTVITAVTVLTTVLVGVSTALIKLTSDHDSLWTTMRKTKKANDELIDSLEESKTAYEETVKETEDETDAVIELVNETIVLAKKTGRSADETAVLKANVESLNNSIDGLNLAYSEETGLLNMSTEALEKKAKAYKAEEEEADAIERKNEILVEQQDVLKNLEVAKKYLSGAEKDYYEELERTGKVSIATSAFYAQQQKAVEGLEAQKKSLKEQERAVTDTIIACQEEQAAAVTESQALQQSALAESIANQTVQLEDLSEANQETVTTLKEAWQDYTDSATDMFDTLSDEQTLSVEEMISNIQKNQEVIAQWGDNMEALRDRFANLGLSQGILDDLADMGPEGAGYVAALVTASDEQLATLDQAFQNGGELAKESLLESLGVDSNEIPEAIQNMFQTTEDSLRETVKGTDWSSIGGDITTGLAEGIDSGSDDVATASGQLGTDAENALRDETQTHSPSVVFQNIGQDLVAGLAQGLMDNGVAQEAATQMATGIVQIVKNTLDEVDFSTWNRAFSGMSLATADSMAQIASAVRNGMSDTTASLSSGTSSMQKMMKTGMTSIGNETKTGMGTVEKYGTSGMKKFVAAISDGMVQSKLKAVSGVSGILSALSPLQSNFYNSGYYASIGLANGINAGAPSAIAAANRLANQVAATMNSALKVGSPSRVTRKIGGFTTEGFALGLLDDVSEVKRAAAEVAVAAIPTGYISRSIASAGSRVSDLCFEYEGDVSASYTIIVPLEIEGREVARATATYTQEELEKKEKLNKYMKGSR